MNKSYRSIWNPSLGCYVAAPECATVHTMGTSSARAVRSGSPIRSKSVMALEPRILFDGAMLVTAIEADSAQVPEAEVVEAPAAVEDTASDQPATAEDAPDAAVADDPVQDPAQDVATSAADADADDDGAADDAEDDVPVATGPQEAARTEVVFVDGRVSDPSAFAAEGREVVVLSSDQDGLTQIANALAGRTGIGAIHIVSHGGDGHLSLGSGSITAETIQSTNLSSLQLIGQSLAEDGDILIYACDYAAGDAGLEAMQLIADITGADVAASTDATGHGSRGGDWTLEQATGEIETQALDMASWQGELATFTGTALAPHLVLSGSATSVSSDTIRLTPNLGDQGGSAQSSFEISLGTDFTLSFSVNLGTSDAGADGVAFIMHNDPAGAQALGAVGGGLGAQGIRDGVVIEFDTYYNGAPDITNDHTAMWDSDNMSDVLVSARDLGNIENGAWYPVVVTWTASTQTLSYTVNGVSMGSASGLVTAGRFGSGDTVHFGWTGATGGATNEQSVRITSFTGELNFAPVAVNDSFTASEEGATLLVNVMANDSDPEGGALSVTPVTTEGSAGGFISRDDSGNLVFIAGPSFDDLGVGQTRDTTFTYMLSDDQGGTATATITVTVQGANDAPNAQDDHYDVSEDGGHTLGSVRANDSDVDSDEIWADFNATEGTNGGMFSQDDAGNLIFVPGSSFDSLAAGETRDTSFSYVLHDGDGGQSAATVTVTVHGVNDAPVGVADHYMASEDAASSLGRVSVNDWDVDGTEIWVDTSALGAGDQGGFFSFDDGGSLIFNPNGDFEDLGVGESRDTRFVYTLYDDLGASSTATVTVTVLGANDNPVGQDDSFVGYEDMVLSLGSLVGNDSDVDGDELHVSLPGSVEGSAGGRFWMDEAGNLVFDAEGDFEDLGNGDTRDTSFTYTVYDGQGGAGEATVTVTVVGRNDNPVAVDDHFDAQADAVVSLGSPLDNDTDAEGQALVLEQTQAAAGSHGGQFSVDGDGNLVFDPAGDFDDLLVGESRDTRFTYTVLDSQGGVDTGTVTVTVHRTLPSEGGPVVNLPPGGGDENGAVVETPTYPNQIVFVDARVPDPYAFATDGRELVIISAEQDGLVQMASALAGRTGIEAVHIVSHGSEGSMTLGLGDIQAGNVQAFQIEALQAVAQALTEDGDILIYACEFAGGEAGLNAMLLLSQYTQADVAASLFVTGSPSLGGNWSLEATVGSVEADSIVPQNWSFLLNVPQDTPPAQPATPAVAQQPVAQAPAAPVVPVAAAPDVPGTIDAAEVPTVVSVAPVVAASPAVPLVSARVNAPAPMAQEPALQVPSTTRVHELETALRNSLQALPPRLVAEANDLEPIMVELHGDAQDPGAVAAVPAWHVERQEIWTASRPWLDERVLQDAEDDATDGPVQAAPGFRTQLNRFAQWGMGRPVTRAMARG